MELVRLEQSDRASIRRLATEPCVVTTDIEMPDLRHYVSPPPGPLEIRLLAARCAGPILWPVDFEETGRVFLADAAEIIDVVLNRRVTQHPEVMPIRFVVVEREEHRAFIEKGSSDYVIVLTAQLLEVMRAVFSHLMLLKPIQSLFGIEGPSYDFPTKREGLSWIVRLVTREAPKPSRMQVRAATELSNLALALLINHEVAHAINGHFDVTNRGSAEGFHEGDAQDGSSEPEDWAISQCLEIDADSAAIDLTLKDCLVGAYAPHWRDDFGQAETSSLIAHNSRTCVRAVMFTNLILWAYLEGGRERLTDWERSHPPLLFRCLAMTEVTEGVIARIQDLRAYGAPVIEPAEYRAWFHEVADAFEAAMRMLGNTVVDRLDNVHAEKMTAHTNRLYGTWLTLRERLPAFAGRPISPAAPMPRPP